MTLTGAQPFYDLLRLNYESLRPPPLKSEEPKIDLIPSLEDAAFSSKALRVNNSEVSDEPFLCGNFLVRMVTTPVFPDPLDSSPGDYKIELQFKLMNSITSKEFSRACTTSPDLTISGIESLEEAHSLLKNISCDDQISRSIHVDKARELLKTAFSRLDLFYERRAVRSPFQDLKTDGLNSESDLNKFASELKNATDSNHAIEILNSFYPANAKRDGLERKRVVSLASISQDEAENFLNAVFEHVDESQPLKELRGVIIKNATQSGTVPVSCIRELIITALDQARDPVEVLQETTFKYLDRCNGSVSASALEEVINQLYEPALCRKIFSNSLMADFVEPHAETPKPVFEVTDDLVQNCRKLLCVHEDPEYVVTYKQFRDLINQATHNRRVVESTFGTNTKHMVANYAFEIDKRIPSISGMYPIKPQITGWDIGNGTMKRIDAGEDFLAKLPRPISAEERRSADQFERLFMDPDRAQQPTINAEKHKMRVIFAQVPLDRQPVNISSVEEALVAHLSDRSPHVRNLLGNLKENFVCVDTRLLKPYKNDMDRVASIKVFMFFRPNCIILVSNREVDSGVISTTLGDILLNKNAKDAGTVFCHAIEKIISHNDRTLQILDNNTKFMEKELYTGNRMSVERYYQDLPELRDTLIYVRGRVEEDLSIIEGLENRKGVNYEGIFTNTTLERAEQMIGQLKLAVTKQVKFLDRMEKRVETFESRELGKTQTVNTILQSAVAATLFYTGAINIPSLKPYSIPIAIAGILIFPGIARYYGWLRKKDKNAETNRRGSTSNSARSS